MNNGKDMKEELLFLAVLVLILACMAMLTGCSSTTQKLVTVTNIPQFDATITETASLSRTSFMYWTKFQGEAKTGEMTTTIYNAECRPDTESIKAIVNSEFLKYLKLFADATQFKFVSAE